MAQWFSLHINLAQGEAFNRRCVLWAQSF
jgi:hypothetical protein